MTKLAIKASGMVTAVGFNSAASCAAMRAGIRNISETNLWDAESGEMLAAGRVLLPQWWTGTGKLAELVAPAINECFEAAHPVPPKQVPVILGVSSPARPCRPVDLEDGIFGEIAHRFGFQLHADSRVIPRDRVSTIAAVQMAGEFIASKRVRYCIVAAVDSLVQQDIVEYYLGQRRILTSMNSNGFSPGEAGSAILVGAAGGSVRGELEFLGLALAREEATIESENPLRGDGLAGAIGQALKMANLTIEDMDYRIADLDGEHYQFKEMVLALTRYQRKVRQDLFDMWHPSEYIGNVGAAISPVILGVALHASQHGYGPGPRIMCTLGNDDGERGVMLMQYKQEGK